MKTCMIHHDPARASCISYVVHGFLESCVADGFTLCRLRICYHQIGLRMFGAFSLPWNQTITAYELALEVLAAQFWEGFFALLAPVPDELCLHRSMPCCSKKAAADATPKDFGP